MDFAHTDADIGWLRHIPRFMGLLCIEPEMDQANSTSNDDHEST